MAVICRFRALGRYECCGKNLFLGHVTTKTRFMCTVIEQPRPKSIFKFGFIGAGIGVLLGTGYAFKTIKNARQNLALEGTQQEIPLMKFRPDFKPSRRIVSPVDNTGLKLTLFQYQSCPFCCKVRVLLDYFGLSYDVVEVDPVLRTEIGWSTYKKVPILLAKTPDGYQPLNDSSMIVSSLVSYLHDNSQKLDEVSKYYPIIALHDEDGKFKHDVVNKYFIMYQNSVPKDKSMDDIVEERKWRKWADDVLVHTLSPNVYRTLSESYQTFNSFSKVGNWEEYFPWWKRTMVINVGALAMWLIGKRLKKKHHIKEDARESLYDEVNYWLGGVKARGGTFMGGQNPDLSDLAVYAVLKSIEGCDAFKDLFANTNIKPWYFAVKERVDSHAGSVALSN